jgi:flotillin
MNTLFSVLGVGNFFGAFFIPGMILLCAVAFVIVVRVMASRYKKIPPNAVGIFYGRKYKGPKGELLGFRVVSGGGSLLLPLVENYQEMSTAAFQTEIDENNIPNQDNVKISVKGVATCKISTGQEDLYSAAKAFLGKGDEQIKQFVKNILQGHLRSIIGKLDIDKILRERDTFNKQVVDESTEELKRLGIQVITLVIQEVNDEYGYIDALGKKAVAEAKRDAEIRVAEAQKDAAIRVSTATKEAEKVKAENEAMIAEAQKERDVKKAQYKVIADSELAKANQALAIATAEQEKTLKVKQAQRDAAEREAQIIVQTKEALRKQEELTATVVKVAEADKQKQVIDAEAQKQVAILQAEAAKEVQVRKAEGEKQARTMEGEGEASKTRATLTALAEGEAAKRRQALLAEAEGTQKLAEALARMTESAKLIMILDRLPALIDKGGDALSKVARETFSSIAAPLGNIDELRIIDFGGSGKGLDQISSLVPQVFVKTITALQAQGIDIEKLLGQVGINVEGVKKIIGADAAQAAQPEKEE